MQKIILNFDEHRQFITAAIAEAKRATCDRRKCGSVLVKDGEIIGRGNNTPPGNLKSQRRFRVEKETYHTKVTDKTCCVHAEQRAIMLALQNHGVRVKGSTLYFVAVDPAGAVLFSDEPYCTICSKLALDVGLRYFVLQHRPQQLMAYETEYYNQLSYKYL